MARFEFEHWLAHCARAIAWDALDRTARLGELPDEHHFYLTFRTDFDGVSIPDSERVKANGTMVVVLQHGFRDLVLEEETIAVTVYFGGEPARIRIPLLALTQFLDPSVSFVLDFPDCDQNSCAELIAPMRFAHASLARLRPLERMDYGGKGDRLQRAITAWTIGKIVEGERAGLIADLVLDTRVPGFKIATGTPVSNRWTLRIDDQIEEVTITDQNFNFPGDGFRKVVPLSAIRSVTVSEGGSSRTLELAEAAPDDLPVAVPSVEASLRAFASRAGRAVMVFALETVAKLGRLPQGHHFYLTFDTQYPGVEVPPDVGARFPATMTIVLQHSFRDLLCTEDALLVTLSFDGKEARVRVPYLAVSHFQDPEAEFDRSFRPEHPAEADGAMLLKLARDQVGEAERIDRLDYSALEQRASRVAVAAALADLAGGRKLRPGERFRVLVDRGRADFPSSIVSAPLADSDAPIELQLDSGATEHFSTEAAIGWRHAGSTLRIEIPYSALREFTAISHNDEHTLKFSPEADANTQLARVSEPAHVRVVQRFIATSGHLVHKLKAKDTTGRWAQYFVLVLPAREREFLASIEGTGNVDLEDYGKVIASCYGESVSDEVRQFLFDLYGFEV